MKYDQNYHHILQKNIKIINIKVKTSLKDLKLQL